MKTWSLALALALATAAGSAAAQVRMGLIDMYGGGFAAQADAIRTGFQIALDEANAAGGVKGQKFTLTTADMGISVEKAITEARRMILEERMKYVTVGSHSGAAVALADLLRSQDAFGLGAFATTKRFTGEEGHAMIARGNLSTYEIGRIMAAHIKGMPQVKRVATIAPDFEFGKHFAEDFIAALKEARPDVQVVRQEWPKFGAADFTPQATALQAAQVDMIVSALFSADLINFLKAARAYGLFSGKTRFFTSGADLVKMTAFRDSMPEGSLVTVWYPFYAIKSPENARFIDEVQKRTGTYPVGSTLVGYVAGKMLTLAIQKAKDPQEPRSVAAAMNNLQFAGPVGPVRVRSCDHMALYNFFVGAVKKDERFPDGIGVSDVKAYNTADYARPCEEIARVRKR
ncbi:MAG TPA: ABC transporter substrate-binding protein [Burkholderiales bacterium]